MPAGHARGPPSSPVIAENRTQSAAKKMPVSQGYGRTGITTATLC
jgi:hypothetical protein